MKLNLKTISLIMLLLGLIGLIALSINAIVDSMAVDIISGIIVQLLFASLFISGFIGFCITNTENSK